MSDYSTSDYKIGQKPDWVKPPSFSMEFKTINEPLQGIYRDIRDRLRKEVDPYAFHFLLQGLLTTNADTHRAIVKLIGKDETPHFPFQAFVLIRTMVDSLFNVVALKTDPERLSRQFDLAGYRATWERRQREKVRYGNDPAWRNHFEEQEKFLEFRAKHRQLPDHEKTNPQSLPVWPTPGQMLRKGKRQIPFSQKDREFLDHINTWYYGDFSSYSHVNWGGMALSTFGSSPEEQWIPGMLESQVAMHSLLFMLMLVSEVEACKKYGTNENLKYLWVLLAGAFADAKDYYEMRYRELLN